MFQRRTIKSHAVACSIQNNNEDASLVIADSAVKYTINNLKKKGHIQSVFEYAIYMFLHQNLYIYVHS